MARVRLILIAAVLTLLVSCSPPETPTSATYEQPARTVRPDETPLRRPVTADGDTGFTVLGLTTGIKTLLGSHAESPAKGAFTRVRVLVVNTGRNTVPFDARRQRLVLRDGATALPDEPAMLVKRQPDTFDLGAGMRVEFDLYYDIPVGAEGIALRAHGGPTLTDARDDEYTEIPLK